MSNSFIDKIQSVVDLTSNDVRGLENICNVVRTYPARRDLIREGDDAGPMLVILDGWACRYKLVPGGGRQITAFLLPGDLCNTHVGVIDAMDYSLCTLTAARVAFVPRDAIDSFLASRVEIAQAIWKMQLVDESILRSWIVNMGRRTAIERVAHLMCELHVRTRVVATSNETDCPMPLTQVVLADALGLTSVHVNRVLRILKAGDIMTIGAGTLTISDFTKLAAIAGFDGNYLHRRLDEAA